jgi:hypothetical protein
MKKLLLMIAVVLASTACLKAQDKRVALSIGAEGMVPVGDFNNTHKFGIGGSLQAEYKPAADIGLTVSLGYLSFSGKSVGNLKYKNASFVPVMGGVKYYFSPKVYAHGQLGVAFGASDIVGSLVHVNGKGSLFAYSPGIGFQLSPQIDAEIKYLGLSQNSYNLNSAGVRLAYNF